MFWYDDKTQSVDSVTKENGFESTFKPATADGGTITIKRIFNHHNKTFLIVVY